MQAGTIGEGIYLEGKFVRVRTRTVAPKEGGKVFEPFSREEVTVSAYGGEVTRRVEFEPGQVPEELQAAQEGDPVRIKVRFGGVYQGDPQWLGIAGE